MLRAIYDEDPNDGRPGVKLYDSICFTGRQATHTLVAPEMEQREHPRDALRAARADIGEPGDVQRAQAGPRTPRGEARA